MSKNILFYFSVSTLLVLSFVFFNGAYGELAEYSALMNMRDVSTRVEAEQRIAASESFNRGVLNSLSSHIAVIDASGTIVAVNESWKRFALENGDAGLQGSGQGSNYFAVCEQAIATDVEGAAEALQGLKDVMDQKTPLFYLEYLCHSPDVERWFAMRVMKFDSEEPMVVVAHENITKIKKAERDLTQSLKVITDYKFALDQASIVAITDRKGIIRFVNENFCKISRFSREELIGQDHRIVNSGYHHREFMKNLWTTITGGNVWRDEIKNRAKDGTYYWVDTTIVPFLDDNGKPFQYVAIRADITKRKEAEESLQRNESRLNEAQSMSHTGNWESDLVKNSDVWSDELYFIFGIEKQDVVPSSDLFLSFIHPDETDFARKKIEATFLTREQGWFNFRFFRKDGILRHGYAEWRFEFDGNSHPVRLYGIVQDVTERKLAEEEKEKMISNIIVHSRNLEQFTYIVSHNLRAPVANILGISEVLKGDITELERIKGQQFLQVAVQQMDQVLLDLNKILQIRSQLTEIKERVSLTGIVNEIEANLKSLVESEDVHISADFSAVDELQSIKSYLHSIVYNLISNSIKYRKPGIPALIHIASSVKNGRVQISFRDNGTGIDMSRHSSQVFGLYKRFHLNTEGKGMGLFMVKTQVEAMGGSIHVESTQGIGTEFIIELPE